MIIEELRKDLISAQKEKAADKLLVLRYLLSQIKNYEIELRTSGGSNELSDEDALLVLKRQIKRRKKAIDQYRQGNRQDLVSKEEAELKIMEDYYSKFSSELVE